jgi:hypothetical protein
VPEFNKSDSKEMDARRTLASEFYAAVLEEDEVPLFVSDESTLYDIFAGDDQALAARCAQHYGVVISRGHFEMPFWKLLDQLQAERDREPNNQTGVDH